MTPRMSRGLSGGDRLTPPRGINLNCQLSFNPMVHSLRKQISWFSFDNGFDALTHYNPLRPLIQWYHGRIVNAYVSEKLEARLEMRRAWARDENSSNRRARTIIDLALNEYEKEGTAFDSDHKPLSGPIDPYFKRICMAQIKIFLFSGHDTTASGLCYLLYFLTHRAARDRLCGEHDTAFGPDPSRAAARMAESPHLLHQLPYTTAFIKECLRLHPPSPLSRQGQPGYAVADAATGRTYPTDGFLVFPNPHGVQNDPAYWACAEAFLPERWLAAPGDNLHPVKGAWRVFEHGARNCIAQELAMLEMRIVLVLWARRFVMRDAYAELDARRGWRGRELRGEPAYQCEPMMQPRDDMPCRVEVVTGS